MNKIAKIKDIIFDDKNANKGTERGHGMLEESLRKYGMGRSILIDKNNRIIAGNKTASMAGQIGIEDIVVVPVDGNKIVAVQRTDLDLKKDKKARELAYADNRIGQVDLDWDLEQLKKDIDEGIDLSGMWREDEINSILAQTFEEKEEEEFDIDAALEESKNKYITKPGEMYKLGKHRLLCGDSTKEEDVKRVLEGQEFMLTLTDPPYSVDYLDCKRRVDQPTRRDHGDEYSDPKKANELLKFVNHQPSDLLVMTYGLGKRLHELSQAFVNYDLIYNCVWVKNRFAFNMHARYQQKHEPILIFRKKKHKHPGNFNVPANQSTVFEYNMPTKNVEHPTIRPLELWVKLMELNSNFGDYVYEPFCGSGTTIIAAEQTGRICHAIELQPQYCDVIINRWEKLTGKKAELIKS